ncbi:MAG: hypothetical protein H0A76_05070 [Candidatus Thiodubiliella endoseptemdiera]|uniref:Uncharacterized protein n=1 Tax=Candidatus Thiodubiliella endoseptemdiera TaxID=2738886 RepID=A0A853F6D9_9GAMM|nr:hypothetical protein [Candidatus Thiodubiliella endoseptemdiera]
MDKTESIVKHAMTLGAIVWSIDIIANKIEQISYIIFAFVCVIIAFIIFIMKQNKFIGDKTAQMTKHNEKLEKQIDPKRTSSQLTERGQTNPLDK